MISLVSLSDDQRDRNGCRQEIIKHLQSYNQQDRDMRLFGGVVSCLKTASIGRESGSAPISPYACIFLCGRLLRVKTTAAVYIRMDKLSAGETT